MPGKSKAGKADLAVKLIGVFKELIADGSLVPGGRLLAERDLATSFGVRRKTGAEAILGSTIRRASGIRS